MRSLSRSATFFSNMLLITALAGMWFAFAPTKIGGSASYVIVQGNSMEPYFQRGDLAIIRSASTYAIGDIVTYWDETLPAFVIHRIVGIEQNHFTLKGDNNTWVDITHPSLENILGKLWVHIPRLGKLMEWLQEPLHFALIAALFGGILMTALISKPGNSHTPSATSSNPHHLEVGIYVAVTIFLVFFGLLVYAFSNPALIPASEILYQQEGHFSYTAASIPGIYDQTTIRSGEPIFPSHTCLMNVGFSYYISNAQLQGISGNHQLYARVLDEQSGWQRTIPMNQESPFSGNAFASTGTIDLCQVELLVTSLEEQTGLSASNYKLEIIAPVRFSGSVSGKNIADVFAPVLTFRFDDLHFYLDNSDKSDAAFIFTKTASNNGVISEQVNYLNLLGIKFNVQSLRILSVTGLLFSIGAFGIIGIYAYFLTQEDPDFLLRLKYSNLLVDVQGVTFEPASPVIDVDSMQTLAKLAERHSTMILHITHPMLHDYLVQTAQSTYRYSLHRSVQSSTPTPVYENEILYSPPISYNTAPPQSVISSQNQPAPNIDDNGYW